MHMMSGSPASSDFQDGVGGKRRGHEDDRGIGARFLHRLRYGVEHRPALMRRAALARRNSAHYFGPILGAAFGMKGAFLAGNSLHNEPRIFVH